MVSQNHGGGERGEGKAGEKRKKKKKIRGTLVDH